jgi:hypothetical protein
MVNIEPGEFGPNTGQVERFLALLDRLDDDDWATVEAAGLAAPAAELPAEVLLTFAGGFAKRAGDVAFDRAPRPGNVDLLAQRAAQALAVRDQLGDLFAAVYRPFDDVVPLDCVSHADCTHQKHHGHVVPLRGNHTSDGSE